MIELKIDYHSELHGFYHTYGKDRRDKVIALYHYYSYRFYQWLENVDKVEIACRLVLMAIPVAVILTFFSGI